MSVTRASILECALSIPYRRRFVWIPDAWPGLASRPADDDGYPLVIVGAGPVEAELRQHAADVGLTKIKFLGALPDIDKVALFNLSYAVVFPSHLRSEAFGISLLEGAMFGKPMISSEIGTGTSYINSHEETGLVVPPNDPGAMRVAMRLLWDNPMLAGEMRRRAKQRYMEHFRAEKMVDRYINLYQEVISKRQS
jgi:glycosyltransferase involved in cell wall biosynthesis